MASDSKSSKNKYIDINRCVDVDELAKIFGTKVKVEPAAEKREKIEEKATSSRPSIVFKYSKKEVGEDEVYIEREGKTPKNVGKEAKSAEIREPDTLDENEEKMEIDMRKLPNPFDDPEWNQAAYLRFFQIIVEHAIPYERSAYSIYNHYVAEKMRYIESTEDENVLILIVDEADHHKIGKTPAIFLKPAYEIRPTPEEIQKKFYEFYGLNYYYKYHGIGQYSCFRLRTTKKSSDTKSNDTKNNMKSRDTKLTSSKTMKYVN